METINVTGLPDRRMLELDRQESNQSLSDKYHIGGQSIQWDSRRIERFWKEEFVKSMREVEPCFVINDHNKGILSALYDYVWGVSTILDSQKGLLLWGTIGVGKSLLIKGLQRYYGKINRYCFGGNHSALGFKLTSAAEIALLYAEKGMDGIVRYTDRSHMHHLAIDELGREPLDAKHFGTGINVVQVILQLRYEVRREFVTFATTNLNPDTEFEGRYGDYISDRVKEMFNVIEIKGNSWR